MVEGEMRGFLHGFDLFIDRCAGGARLSGLPIRIGCRPAWPGDSGRPRRLSR